MTSKLFYDNSICENHNHILKNQEEYNHIVKSFRMKIGETLYLSNGIGLKQLYRISQIDKEKILLEFIENTKELKPKFRLVQGITKNENKDTIEILSEIGISEYIPWKSENSLHPDPKSCLKLQKSYSNQAIIGSKIARSSYLPKISEVQTTKQILEYIDPKSTAILYEEILSVSKNIKSVENIDTLIIGPEGGITDNEIKMFIEKGCKIISLGTRILSSKVATIKAVSILDNLS